MNNNEKINKKNKPKWKRFEEAVAVIQRNIAPNAQIKHDETIIGKSGINRQIDIAVRYNVGQFKILIVVDCKDWSRPVDIGDVGKFIDMVEDVSANKGALICNKGFTEGAKKRANEKGIDLFRVIDTENPDIKLNIGFPALCDFRYINSCSFCFSTLSIPFKIPVCDLQHLEIYKEDNSFNDIVRNLLIKAWNAGNLPIEVGRNKKVKFIEDTAFTKVNDKFYGPISITADINVDRKLFFGDVPLQQGQGFVNEISSSFTTNSINFGLDAIEVEKNWRRLSNEKELAVKPTFTFLACDCYPIIEYKGATNHFI